MVRYTGSGRLNDEGLWIAFEVTHNHFADHIESLGVFVDDLGQASGKGLEHARARGAEILAEVAGFAMCSDAHDIVMPSAEGAVRAMRGALLAMALGVAALALTACVPACLGRRCWYPRSQGRFAVATEAACNCVVDEPKRA